MNTEQYTAQNAEAIERLEDEVSECAELLDAAAATNGRPRDEDGMREAATRMLAALDRLEVFDPGAIVTYGPLRSEAQAALAIVKGGAALCALTGKPRKELTDLGNAERFAADHADELIYVPGPGWHGWDSRRWKADADGAAQRAAKNTARGIRDEANVLEDKDLAKKVFGWAIMSQARPRLEAAVKLAETELSLISSADDLDADPDLLNVANGTVDLRTGERRAHDRADLLTKISPVEHDPDATCPRWHKFLEQIMAGDPEMIRFLQVAVGYTLTGHTIEQCLFMPIGNGANGKTTFEEIIGALAGDYATKTDASTFMARGAAAGAPRSDVARLRGARYVHAAEIEQGAQFAEVFIKQATGGDTLVARPLFKGEFEFRPQFTVWIAANHEPNIRGTDHAIWRRIRKVPFDVKITKPDKRLPERLRAELPGILNWALEGAAAWHRDGLPLPTAVRDATQDYRATQDTVGQFIDSCCQLAPAATISPTHLYSSYADYCTDEGAEPLPRPQFKKALEARGLDQQKRAKGIRRWAGIGIEAP